MKKKVIKKSEEFLRKESRYCYIVTNPAFPNYIKLGITNDPVRRLISYQTADPFRKYKLEYKILINSFIALEIEKHFKCNFSLDNGEWYKMEVNTAISIIKEILDSYNIVGEIEPIMNKIGISHFIHGQQIIQTDLSLDNYLEQNFPGNWIKDFNQCYKSPKGYLVGIKAIYIIKSKIDNPIFDYEPERLFIMKEEEIGNYLLTLL